MDDPEFETIQLERVAVFILAHLLDDDIDPNVAVDYVCAWLDAIERWQAHIRRLPPIDP